MSVELMLRHKDLSYSRRELPIGFSGALLRLRGFSERTVPALLIDGERVQGSRNISRALDAIRPDPPLFPADPIRRQAVEEAEEFGEQLQDAVRRIELCAIGRRPSAARSQLEASELPMPTPLALAFTPATVRYLRRINGASDDAVARDLRNLPGMLDRVDQLIAAGTLDADHLNAADFQLAPTLSLLLASDDLRRQVEGRPAQELAQRVAPHFPASLPAGSLPPEWLTANATR